MFKYNTPLTPIMQAGLYYVEIKLKLSSLRGENQELNLPKTSMRNNLLSKTKVKLKTV